MENYKVFFFTKQKLDNNKIINLIDKIINDFNLKTVRKIILFDNDYENTFKAEKEFSFCDDFYECTGYNNCKFKDSCNKKNQFMDLNSKCEIYNMEYENYLISDNCKGFNGTDYGEIGINISSIKYSYEDYLKNGQVEEKDTFSKYNIFQDDVEALSGIMINTIIHELYHSYQKENHKDLSCIEATKIAFEIFSKKFRDYKFFLSFD